MAKYNYRPKAEEINFYEFYNPFIKSTFYSFSFVDSNGSVLLSTRLFMQNELDKYVKSLKSLGNKYFSYSSSWHDRIKGKVPRGTIASIHHKSERVNSMTELMPSGEKTIERIIAMLLGRAPEKQNN
jgi:hypothetical protein